MFSLEKVCHHPEDIVGNLVNQNDKITTYFVDGRSYYLTCPMWYRIPEGNSTLWTCLDGDWVSGDDCIGEALVMMYLLYIYYCIEWSKKCFHKWSAGFMGMTSYLSKVHVHLAPKVF